MPPPAKNLQPISEFTLPPSAISTASLHERPQRRSTKIHWRIEEEEATVHLQPCRFQSSNPARRESEGLNFLDSKRSATPDLRSLPPVRFATISESFFNNVQRLKSTEFKKCPFGALSSFMKIEALLSHFTPLKRTSSSPQSPTAITADALTHLLHGLIHCNGFGHLLCINGIEGGSKFLYGREVMDLWDRICTNLRTRKITVEDLSKKRSMDLRLLHGVAYGHPWFGRWGYRFCRGSFGVKEHHYNRALEILSSLELDKIIHDVDDTDRGAEMKQIIRHYRSLSETHLITLKDLLKFMLTVKYVTTIQKKSIQIQPIAKSPPPSRQSLQRNKQQPLLKEKQIRYKKFATAISNMDSRWPARRLEFAAEVIVKALEEKKRDRFSHGGNGMTRQDVRDAARLHIGDTGLLDYVLKSLNNVIVGNQIVRRAINAKTRILEYTIHELRNGVQLTEEEQESAPTSESNQTPGDDIYSDVLCVYRSIFLDYPESDMVELATQGVLDSKHFAKEWPLRDEEDHLLTFICRLTPRLAFTQSESEIKNDFMPAGEVIVLPLHATIGDVKEAAEKALRDTYYVTEQFVVMEIENMENFEDGEVIFGAVESGMELFVKGMGMDLETPLKYQGGVDTWKVRCECGAGDDDGERMVACDICEVWQHTRCCGIDDSDNVPPLFVCAACCDSLGPLRI